MEEARGAGRGRCRKAVVAPRAPLIDNDKDKDQWFWINCEVLWLYGTFQTKTVLMDINI